MQRPSSTDTDDLTLVDALRHGSRPAFAILMKRHGPAVFRYAWRLADDTDQADDILQDTFLILWRRRRQIDVVGLSLLPWLLATAKFVCFNANRKLRTHRAESLDDVAEIGGSNADFDELAWLRDEIARLGTIDQRLVQLCLIEGRGYPAAARELGLTPAAARKRIQRTRARFAAARNEN
jgi:RNA polymerase sigma factor (sigma-70 family)